MPAGGRAHFNSLFHFSPSARADDVMADTTGCDEGGGGRRRRYPQLDKIPREIGVARIHPPAHRKVRDERDTALSCALGSRAKEMKSVAGLPA